MNRRVVYLDYVRVFACFLVVLIHSPMHNGIHSSTWLSLYNYFSVPCIGLFFMVSGALLVPSTDPPFAFIKKRFHKIIVPLIFWSLFYLVVKVYAGIIPTSEILSKVIESLYSPSIEGVLWFLYSLLGLYLFVPIISCWVSRAGHQDYIYFLCLWCITLFLPYLDITTPFLQYFIGYMGYMILGVYLNKYPIKNKFVLIALFVIAILFPCLGYFSFLLVDNSTIYECLSINIMILCVLYFSLIQLFFKNENKFIIKMSNLSFGIYLIHIFVMRYFLWDIFAYFGRINYLFEIPIVAFFTFSISLFIVNIISKIKYLKLIVGL